VIRKLGFKPYESDYRMVIIWLPEKMNDAAANKLLKQLEDPPERTLILMAAENTDRILPTILSRAQLLHVPPLGENILREALLKLPGTDPHLIEDAVRRANGNFNNALTILRTDEQELRYFELFTGVMRLAFSRNVPEIYNWVEEVAGMGRERRSNCLIIPGTDSGKFHPAHETTGDEPYVGQGGGVFNEIPSLHP
jgi:DNA polymerase-3 subunit delta'